MAATICNNQMALQLHYQWFFDQDWETMGYQETKTDIHSMTHFFNALMRCQSTRLNEQALVTSHIRRSGAANAHYPRRRLIVRMQSSRIEDQRCSFSPIRESLHNVDPDNDDISQQTASNSHHCFAHCILKQ
uniref:uncharacterized protein LOC120344542 isoform X2 n=1 Tax=Styela clava TaxID=7725 RepID=UPI00193A2CAA|nr:uncharacterized protein LOC120344542 isoform X2 [Styela clava]